VNVVVLECCEKTVCVVAAITDIINSGQMQRQYKSEAAERKPRVEQEKRDEHIKKKMPCLLTRSITSLGHQGGESLLREAQMFQTVSNTFFLVGRKIFQERRNPPCDPGYGPVADIWAVPD